MRNKEYKLQGEKVLGSSLKAISSEKMNKVLSKTVQVAFI